MFLKDSAKSLGGVFDREERWGRDEREIQVRHLSKNFRLLSSLKNQSLAEINLLSGIITFSSINIYFIFILILILISLLFRSTLNVTMFITQSTIPANDRIASSLKIHSRS